MRMLTVILAVLALSLVSLGTVPARAAGDHAKVTVQGEILDMACYIGHGAKGPDHAACAKRCVKGGQPMGLLADDGTVYLLYASHDDGSAFEKAKDFAGKKVEIAGTEATRSGMKAIEVLNVKPL